MSQAPRTHFTTLTEAEKKSKLWQLARNLGKCTLWQRGNSERHSYRSKEFQRDTCRLELHQELPALRQGTELLGSFELSGVVFFFKGHVSSASAELLQVEIPGDLFKSERRANFRLLAYPIYDIQATFTLPANYQGGKVVDIRKKGSQTGLFKSFLKLVDPGLHEGRTDQLKLRVQDLSNSGMSVFIGELELEWFKAGEELKDVALQLAGDDMTLPRCRIVYVVDHIGPGERTHKKYKVGFRFEELPVEADKRITGKINDLLRSIDANKEFEDFSR